MQGEVNPSPVKEYPYEKNDKTVNVSKIVNELQAPDQFPPLPFGPRRVTSTPSERPHRGLFQESCLRF